jgi:hypothetical protein
MIFGFKDRKIFFEIFLMKMRAHEFSAMPKTWIRPMDSWTMDRSKNGSWIGKNPENKHCKNEV